MRPHLLFDFTDENGGDRPLLFNDPLKILQTTDIEAVSTIFKQVETALDAGYYVAGYVSYESAPAFDPSFRVHPNAVLPLVWFGIFDKPKEIETKLSESNKFQVSNWTMASSFEHYQSSIDKIKQAIADGNTYQINYTTRLQASFHGDDKSFYQQLKRNQQSSYSAYLDIGLYHIISASPELFFQVNGEKIMAKPMKGTARRGRFTSEDQAMAAHLRESEKERAENLMIVDLLRNDIGKIAQSGTVRVPKLLEIETYPTVHQVTSTVEADLAADTTVFNWFQALFPCGSITGAPKRSTMEYIADLEQSPREVYCGAIGYITPQREAIFNVPIRTVTVNTKSNEATYGVGGGITWDSTVDGEYEEMAVKAQLLTESRPEFQLLESLKLENGRYQLETYHLARLEDSASYFDYHVNISNVKQTLHQFAAKRSNGTYKVRLLIGRSGDLTIEGDLIQPISEPIACTLARSPIDKQNPFLFHKTNHREIFHVHQREALPGTFSVLLWNKEDELTEFITGNIVVQSGDKFYTPPVKCGLLPGTFRQELLEKRVITERVLMKSELATFEAIWMVNSVRGWLRVELI